MKYGFEREFFVGQGGNLVLCPMSIAHDDCGFLAEARGLPQNDPLEAAFSLEAAEYKLEQAAAEAKVELVLMDNTKLSPAVKLAALQKYGKSAIPTSRGNVYGRFMPFSRSLQHAGLHLHMSDTFPGKEASRLFDFVTIIQKLDKAFAVEIKAAKRAPGYFEMKAWGVEYRSLPATVDPKRVADVLSKVED